MSEMEMKNDVETEDFTDELSDEALDQEEGGTHGFGFGRNCSSFYCACSCWVQL